MAAGLYAFARRGIVRMPILARRRDAPPLPSLATRGIFTFGIPSPGARAMGTLAFPANAGKPRSTHVPQDHDGPRSSSETATARSGFHRHVGCRQRGQGVVQPAVPVPIWGHDHAGRKDVPVSRLSRDERGSVPRPVRGLRHSSTPWRDRGRPCSIRRRPRGHTGPPRLRFPEFSGKPHIPWRDHRFQFFLETESTKRPPGRTCFQHFLETPHLMGGPPCFQFFLEKEVARASPEEDLFPVFSGKAANG